MTSKKYLSNKKSAQQTIAISPALKDWIKRYVNVNQRKKPNDERFKSVSSFYNHIMRNMMELFERGKTIDDFKRVQDKMVKDFFEPFSFSGIIPLYEMAIQPNTYTHFSFEFSTGFLLMYLDLFKSEVKSHNFKDAEIFFEKIRSRYAKTNVSKDMRLEIYPSKNKEPARGTLEFIGKYKNLHFENCKFFAAVFGMLGVKITDFIYSSDDIFCRMELLETNLLFSEDLSKKKRLKLLNENVNRLINYNRILDDKDMYLWMNLAEDNELCVCFRNKSAFNKWIKIIEEDLTKFGNKENFLHKILLFFNKIHWIRIENLKNLSFQIEDFIESDQEQKQLIMEYLSKYSEVSQNDGIYYLN